MYYSWNLDPFEYMTIKWNMCIKNKLKLGQKLYNSKKWINYNLANGCNKNNDKILVQKLSIPDSPILCLKFSTFINAKPEQVIDKLWSSYDKNTALSLDKTINEFELVSDKVNQNNKIYNISNDNKRIIRQVNNIWPFWPRETLFYEQKIIDKDIKYNLAFTIDPNNYHLEKKNDRVFVDLNIGIFIIEKEKNGSRVTQIIHANPGGYIPSFIVNNFFDDNILSRIRYIQKYFI